MKYNSVVTPEQVMTMKQDYMSGMTVSQVANKYGLKRVTAHAILNESNYKEIKPEGYVYSVNLKIVNKNFNQETLEKIKNDIQFSGETKQVIANRYGISKVTIYKLIKKHGW